MKHDGVTLRYCLQPPYARHGTCFPLQRQSLQGPSLGARPRRFSSPLGVALEAIAPLIYDRAAADGRYKPL
jgi:hypothetical protein